MLVLIGPTAIGKSRVALKICRKIPAEIISADSRLVYRYLQIGADKPSLQDREQVCHWLIDIKNPDEQYTVAEYLKDFWECVRQVAENGKTPVVVGGTMLYIRAILFGYDFGKTPPDMQQREKWKAEEAKQHGILYKKLQQKNPEWAEKLSPSDLPRIIRALERKQTPSSFPPSFPVQFSTFALIASREWIYQRINERVDRMVQQGLREEVQNLFSQYPSNSPAFRTHGYQELVPYFEGKISWEEAIRLVKQHTRNHAKHQLTWLKKIPHIPIEVAGKTTETIASEILSLFLHK